MQRKAKPLQKIKRNKTKLKTWPKQCKARQNDYKIKNKNKKQTKLN